MLLREGKAGSAYFSGIRLGRLEKVDHGSVRHGMIGATVVFHC